MKKLCKILLLMMVVSGIVACSAKEKTVEEVKQSINENGGSYLSMTGTEDDDKAYVVMLSHDASESMVAAFFSTDHELTQLTFSVGKDVYLIKGENKNSEYTDLKKEYKTFLKNLKISENELIHFLTEESHNPTF